MLARMDTHPEEFRPRGYRWEEALGSMLEAASPKEGMALMAKINRFRMDALHEEIMSELLDGKSEKSPLALETEWRAQAIKKYQTAAQVSPPAGMSSSLKAIFK
jgi:hypothetical protein